jgi:tetratricopeptide (TPR) repeat protein
LLPFILVAYTASRNVLLAYFVILLLLAWLISQVLELTNGTGRKVAMVLISGFILATGVFYWFYKGTQPPSYYPKNAVDFIRKNNLQGKMFNEYGYGGYLLYHLYPDYKVFIDGRTDVYIEREIPDVLDMSVYKNRPDDEYKKLLDGLWDKYDISYILLRTQKHSILRKIARILDNDPNWSLVFWDDVSMMYVRKDGKNDILLEKFATMGATPYNVQIYRDGKSAIALDEYRNMNSIYPSARSENALGYLYLQQNDITKADEHFSKAMKLDPDFESPYMNLAEIRASQGKYNEAIDNYLKAQKLAPDRGLIYIRLGELYLEGFGDRTNARKVFEEGLRLTVDEDARKKIGEMLGKIKNSNDK